MKISCDVIVGKYGEELFVWPDFQDASDNPMLPITLNGNKIFLSRSAAKELSDVLLEFVNG